MTTSASAAALCAALLYAVSILDLCAAPRLMGGNETDAESWPFVAAIYEAGRGASRGFLTAGALVHPRFLLTAAHPIADRAPDELACAVGTHLLSDEAAEPLRVVDIIIHPGFAQADDSYRADLALLRLAQPVTEVDPVYVLEALDPHADVSAELVVVGWAGDRRTSRLRDYRQQLTLPVVSLEEGNQESSYNGSLDETMLPLGTAEMENDACLEDSSAPMFLALEDGFQLGGLASFGKGCRKDNKYHIATNLHHFRPWIISFLWPDYAQWEIARQTNGFFVDHDGNGMSNLRQYGAEGALDPEKIIEGWAREDRATIAFPDGLARQPVIQISRDLRAWTELAPEHIEIQETDEATIWAASNPDANLATQFIRISVGIGNQYVPVPKPVPWGAHLVGEIMGPDETTRENARVRDYLLLGTAEEARVRLRVASEDMAIALALIDPSTGAFIERREPVTGQPSSLVFPGSRELIARVSVPKTETDGRFDFSLSQPARGTVRPETLETRVQLGESPDALTIEITNEDAGVLDFAASSQNSWLRLDPPSGVILPGKEFHLRARINTEELAETGLIKGAISIHFLDSETVKIPVELYLLPNHDWIRVNDRVVGHLSPTDDPATLRSPLVVDRYLFEAPSDGKYLVSMGSGVIDPYLYVFDAKTGNLVEEADDNGLGAAYNAGVIRDCKEGELLIIEATCYGTWSRFPNRYGPYQLNLIRIDR